MLKINKFTASKSKSILNRISQKLTMGTITKFQNTAIMHSFSSKLNNDSFVTGTSASYLEQMFNNWQIDRKSVHVSWDSYFTNIHSGMDPSLSFQTPPTIDKSFLIQDITQKGQINVQPKQGSSNIEESLKVILLIRSYQTYGYLNAKIDPLSLFNDIDHKKYKVFGQLKHLNFHDYGFTEQDLEKEFIVKTEGLKGILSEAKPIKLRDIIERLRQAYCGTIGVEFMYNHSREICNFIREKFEIEWINHKPTKEEQLLIYDRLAWAVLFEEFLKNKFTTHKRFGMEGLESLISGLKKFVDCAVDLGLKDITLGMPHRGRLNVLANVFRKPMKKIFAEFQGKHDEYEGGNMSYAGDVKYHLGTNYERSYGNGKKIHLDLLPNPSHLECVNPVVMGKTRAKQHFSGDVSKEDHMAIILHGDAAFAGQGVVYETITMSNLENFTTGGVLHVIMNNQIGFTTTPMDGRSTPFCTDLGKSVEAPIIHVNADDPIAVDFVFKTAAEFSRKFATDIIVDVVGYRKHGHNELDQPMFTQPLMYQKIAKRDNVLKIYEDKLVKDHGIKQEELDTYKNKIKDLLESYFQDASNNKLEKDEWVPKQWQNTSVSQYSAPQDTGVSITKLKRMGEAINTIPTDFNIHPQLKKNYEQRITSIREGKGIDWATAEALAFGHLIEEGYTVRLTGQDVERGTFSHRHSVLHDQINGNKYIPLHQVAKDPKNLQIHNSHLSEFAVLGYELGYSYYSPDALVLWEAQFGDFMNGAQTIIDQFLVSGESKWHVPTGLTLLLPHGMDGQGAEHSSCRIERFLEMMDDDYRVIPDQNSKTSTQIQQANMQVCNPTFSANYFHVLLRQLKRQFRKPLIVPAPKKLLRHKQANSNISEFDEGNKFMKVRQEFNNDVIKNHSKVKKILICSGQVYYDLINRREKLKRNVIYF